MCVVVLAFVRSFWIAWLMKNFLFCFFFFLAHYFSLARLSLLGFPTRFSILLRTLLGTVIRCDGDSPSSTSSSGQWRCHESQQVCLCSFFSLLNIVSTFSFLIPSSFFWVQHLQLVFPFRRRWGPPSHTNLEACHFSCQKERDSNIKRLLNYSWNHEHLLE